MKADSRRSRSLASLVALALIAAAPYAFAQTTKKKKKKPKPATTTAPASNETMELDAPAASSAPATTPAPEATTPPPAETATAPAEAPKEEATATASTDAAASDDVTEKDGKYYRYIGLRYRGTIVPAFEVNLFTDEGTGVFSHQIDVEYEIRHDGFSLIPSLAFATYGFGDTLFLQKGKPATEQYYADVSSSLKVVYAGIDLLWSTPIAKGVDFEYGGGAQLGFVFGSLGDNWVQSDPNGALVSASGGHYSPCATTSTQQNGCNPALHQNATTFKVGGYQEPSWFGGGSKPVIFPNISIPEIGIRFKPTPMLALRAQVGFSLTGFFFALGGSYDVAGFGGSSKSTTK